MGIGMTKLKKTLLSKSLYRQCYIICLFACNISYLHFAAYVVLAFMVIWGAFLAVYHEITRRTSLKTRFGFWLIAFLVSSVVTMLIHLLDNLFINFVFILHLAICFFVFYSVHTEKQLNPKRELFNISRVLIYVTTVMGIVGLACMVMGVNFEFLTVKFIIYENRFTGLFTNPNQLGLAAVVSLFCCHMMLKRDFVEQSGCRRMSRIWIGCCAAVNSISLLLCDSNGALVLLIGYAVFFVVYMMFGKESKFSVKQIIVKSIACLLAGLVIVSSMFLLRTVCQLGFAELIKTKQSISSQSDKTDDEDLPEEITFEHENANVDSGRFVLWQQGTRLFLNNFVFGIGKGNIAEYGDRMFENGIKFADQYGDLAAWRIDFHNGYLSILVCSGIVGFALFMVFAVRIFSSTTRHVLRDERLHNSEFPCMYSFLCAYAVYSFVEVTLLFNITFAVLLFWLILGYTSCYLTKNIPDHPIEHVTIFGRQFRKTLF